MEIYHDGELVETTPVSTGKPGHETPTGVFHIIYRDRTHYSRKYHAPMPYAQFITDYGIALHAGHVPGYAASHGCIRLPADVAKRLWDENITEVDIDE